MSPELRRTIDLLSVVTHEFGHKLGFDHAEERQVMAPMLPPGVQTLSAITSRAAAATAYGVGLYASSLMRSEITLLTDKSAQSSNSWAPPNDTPAVRVLDQLFSTMAAEDGRSGALDDRPTNCGGNGLTDALLAELIISSAETDAPR